MRGWVRPDSPIFPHTEKDSHSHLAGSHVTCHMVDKFAERYATAGYVGGPGPPTPILPTTGAPTLYQAHKLITLPPQLLPFALSLKTAFALSVKLPSHNFSQATALPQTSHSFTFSSTHSLDARSTSVQILLLLLLTSKTHEKQSLLPINCVRCKF